MKHETTSRGAILKIVFRIGVGLVILPHCVYELINFWQRVPHYEDHVEVKFTGLFAGSLYAISLAEAISAF